MALKKNITKEQYAKLKDGVKEEYREEGDGYTLDVEGIEDNGALKRAKDRIAQELLDAKKERDEAQNRLEELEGNDALKNKDVEKLQKQWLKQKTDMEAAHKTELEARDQKIAKFEGYTKKQLIDNVALELATQLNPKSPKVLLPHIKERLQADLDGDSPVTKILDSSGKVSNLTIDQLKAEFVANKDFAGIIIGSQASGSAGNPKPNGSANNQNSNEKPADLSNLDPKALAEHIAQVREQQSQES